MNPLEAGETNFGKERVMGPFDEYADVSYVWNGATSTGSNDVL
jgi:hypothetical protein